MIYRLPEKALIPLTIGPLESPTLIDSSGLPVVAYAIPQPLGEAIVIASTTGAAAGVPLVLNLDLATEGVAPGLYRLEVIAGPDTANPRPLLPNDTEKSVILEIIDLLSY